VLGPPSRGRRPPIAEVLGCFSHVDAARAFFADGRDPARCADDEVAAAGLIDEQLGLDGFGDAQLDRLVTGRRHQDRAADGERTAVVRASQPGSFTSV
jgi:hypothetical protein